MSHIQTETFLLPVFQAGRNRMLAHFVVTMRNVIGATEQISGVLARNHVNILSGYQNAPIGSDGRWSFFVDMTDATLTPDKMSDELAHLSTVIDVKFRSSSGGFLADAFHFPPQLTQGRPVLIISLDSMAMIRSRLDSIMGQRATVDVLFHQMGIANGNGIWKGIESTLGGKPSRENLEEFFHLIRMAGWGVETLKEIDYEASTARLQLAQSAECSFHGQSSSPQSQFVRGSYQAVFSGLFGKPVDVEEVRCIAKGDSVCEFVVKPR